MKMMKKSVIALAIAGALTVSLAAQGDDDVEVSGFIDVIGDSDAAAVFGADAEIDVSKKIGAVTVRVDFDANLADNDGESAGGEDSGRLEQAFFAWAATEQVTVLGGLFNNPIGQEAEDAPDMDFTSHSVIYNILDDQTGLYGNNVAGVAAAGAIGPAKVTLAVVDDIGFATDEESDLGKGLPAKEGKGKTSVALVVNLTPMPGLDLELGYVTQDEQKNNAGDVNTAGNTFDFNAAFNTGPVTVGLDYLTADNIVDNAANLWLGFDVDEKINLKLRYEVLAFEAKGVDDSTRTTVYATYAIEDNLSVALEWSGGDTDADTDGILGIVDDDATTLEFIGTF